MEKEDIIEMVSACTDWEVAICVLVGSQNYNLQNEQSDKDYIVFVVPPAEEKHKKIEFRGCEIGPAQVNDLRRLPERLLKAYPRDVEIIFSTDWYMHKELIPLLRDNRERIAKMNLKKLYEKHIHECNKYSRNIIKKTEKSQHLVEKHGYDTKSAMHAFRLLYVLQVFEETGNFERAIRYEGPDREFLIGVRNGKLKLENVQTMLAQRYELVEREYKEWYLRSEIDTKMQDMIKEGIESFIHRDKERKVL